MLQNKWFQTVFVGLLMNVVLSYSQEVESTTDKPIARDHHAISYDENRQRIVLFGCYSKHTKFLSDTWEFDGKVWHRLEASGPAARSSHVLIYDKKSKKTLLFGGVDTNGYLENENWLWDGRYWKRMEGGWSIRSVLSCSCV